MILISSCLNQVCVSDLTRLRVVGLILVLLMASTILPKKSSRFFTKVQSECLNYWYNLQEFWYLNKRNKCSVPSFFHALSHKLWRRFFVFCIHVICWKKYRFAAHLTWQNFYWRRSWLSRLFHFDDVNKKKALIREKRGEHSSDHPKLQANSANKRKTLFWLKTV